MKRVLVTGADGFIGEALCAVLKDVARSVRRAVLKLDTVGALLGHSPQDDWIEVGDINGATDWTVALRDVEVIVHLAARVHVMKEHAEDPLKEYRRVNVYGTEHLARMAAASGVKRIVFISSVDVNGRRTTDRPFTEESPVDPEGEYAVSKWEAESVLWDICKKSGLEAVVIRAPLVYGPGVGANFFRFLSWIYKSVPLPLKNAENRRSLIALRNLVDVLVLCTHHSEASGRTFLVSDGEDLSMPEMIRCLSEAMGRPARLFSFPEAPLRLAARFVGKQKDMERLFGSMVVDSSRIRNMLNWSPPVSSKEALEETAVWYLDYLNKEGKRSQKR